ncbi:MAG: hypothetical protein NC328_05480 [Muribaculum sp.]|nr:hypothetical protein [Muribaculum sp.]
MKVEADGKKDPEGSGHSPLPGLWRMLLHPAEVREELSEMRIRLEGALKAQSEARAIALAQEEAHRKELIEMSEQRMAMRMRLEEAGKQTEELRRQVNSLTERLEETAEVEETVAAFDKRLSEFEKIKKNLELKIDTLKMQLEESRRRLRESLVSDGYSDEVADGMSRRGLTEPSPIDMRRKTKSISRKQPPKNPDNWFKTLDEETL